MLAKKGPLGKIWLAAHMGEKKVPKVQVVATNIPESIAHIENPSARPRQSQRVARTVAARRRDGRMARFTRWRGGETVPCRAATDSHTGQTATASLPHAAGQALV